MQTIARFDHSKYAMQAIYAVFVTCNLKEITQYAWTHHCAHHARRRLLLRLAGRRDQDKARDREGAHPDQSRQSECGHRGWVSWSFRKCNWIPRVCHPKRTVFRGSPLPCHHEGIRSGEEIHGAQDPYRLLLVPHLARIGDPRPQHLAEHAHPPTIGPYRRLNSPGPRHWIVLSETQAPQRIVIAKNLRCFHHQCALVHLLRDVNNRQRHPRLQTQLTQPCLLLVVVARKLKSARIAFNALKTVILVI
jgi:hypothetical protein